MSEITSEQFTPLDKLSKDIKKAAATMTPREARYLVDLYYQFQDNRIRAAGQIRAMAQAQETEPHQTLDWVFDQSERLEVSIRSVLGEFAKNRIVGAWSQSICGIGPVISAGLIANIDMKIWVCMALPDVKAKRKKIKDQCSAKKSCSAACHEEPVNTVSRVWRYAGLDPTMKWEKEQKRPWNASLKVLCWKVGQSFVKVSSNENDFYGQFYRNRKAFEIGKNDKGEYADQAAKALREKRIGKEKEAWAWYAGCYPAGTMADCLVFDKLPERKQFLDSVRIDSGAGVAMLPPAHIQARAERYAVKLFLSHWHQVAFYAEYGELPPKPYVLSVLGHVDQIQVPNWPWSATS